MYEKIISTARILHDFCRKKILFLPSLGACLLCLSINNKYLQESLANAKVNVRQHCVSLSCLCNSLMQIESVQLLLPPKHAKSREIPREFDLTAVQGHPKSSILVSIESPYVTSYSSLIVTLAVSGTVFEILTLKAIENG